MEGTSARGGFGRPDRGAIARRVAALLPCILAFGVFCPSASGLAAFGEGPPASPQSQPTQTSEAGEKATPPGESIPQGEPKLQVPTDHAIPEEQGPVLLDAPTTRVPDVGEGPDDPELVQEFVSLVQQAKISEAAPRLEEYLKERPNSWKGHYIYGYVLFRQHRLGDSIRELSKSLQLNTENAEAHKVLGRALSILGRYDLALRELEEAERLMPNSAEVYYNRGRIYSIQDDFPRARQEFDAAIRVNPNYMEAYNALGFALEALGDDAAALESYQKAIQINEQHGARFDAPYVNLSGYYGRRGEFQTSLDYARRALELNPSSDLAYYQMAKTYRTLGDWAHAAEVLEKAIAIKPTLSQYHYVLSFAYRKLGKLEESQRALKTFKDIEEQTAELERRRRETRRASSPSNPQ